MKSNKDPYLALGVVKTATQDEIKIAYRNLAKKFHPDLNPGNKVAEEKFKEFSHAYEQIGTPEARTKFDQGETVEQQQAQAQRHYYQTQQDGGRYSHSFGRDMGADDFFEDLFRSTGNTRPGRRGATATDDFPGEDHLYQMSVDFKDAILGAEKDISLPNGKRLQVKIPPGIETGTKLRFKNQGGPGLRNGPPGHVYVEITVNALSGFKRVGPNIETEANISFIEAIEGAEIKIQTLEGSVMLKVPPGVSTGSRLRVKGKGVASTKEPGDQIVQLKVVMPKKLDHGLQKSVQDWGGKFNYNPREQS